jgi:O-antigen ligase
VKALDPLDPVKRSSWPWRLIEAGAIFLLVFTPLAHGAVEPWSEALAELVVLAMAVTYVVGSLRDWELRVELPPGWVPALLFLVLVILQATVPGWSVDPHATRRMAFKLLAVAAFYVLCWNTYRTPGQAQRAIWTTIIMGTLLAVLGIVQRITWNGHLYWIGRPALDSAFGPFVNRTHFAGLMVFVVPLALAFVLVSERRERPRTRRWRLTWGDRLREWNSQQATPRNLVGFLIVVMGGAALISGSRGGVLALLTALAAMVLGSLAGERSWSSRAGRLGFMVLLVILAGVWMNSEVVHGTIERLAEEVGRPEESGRVRIWTDALALWRSAPVLGTGLASFGVAFPSFRTVEAPFVFAHAESDWVQLFTDTGVIGLGLVLATVVSIGLTLLERLRHSHARSDRLWTLAALVALGGGVLQGIGNYNMPIMANLLYLALAIVLGAGVRSRVNA